MFMFDKLERIRRNWVRHDFNKSTEITACYKIQGFKNESATSIYIKVMNMISTVINEM